MTHSSNRRILLIDDSPLIHGDFRKILAARGAAPALEQMATALFGDEAAPAAQGFELDSAFQGREGVAMVEAACAAGRPYAMAFVDMRMPPGWDGVDTIEHLWRVDPQVQVVICTAFSDHPWESVLARLDVQDRLLIVKKPFDSIEVSQLARTLTAKWELKRQAALQMQTLGQAVTDLKATESALRRSNEELAGFAYSVSHDLRTPLSAMNAFSHLLARAVGVSASATVMHYVSRIQANAVAASRLIDDLLALAHVSRAPMQMEEVDLSALSRRILATHGRETPARDVAIAVQDGLIVRGDRRLMERLLETLLANAWKFSSTRSRAQIAVGATDNAAGEPVFFVRDNGCGFDMAFSDKLFGTFQRLHAAHEFPGTGTGLVTASRIVGRHGGRIWAEAAPEQGATFFFMVPPAPAGSVTTGLHGPSSPQAHHGTFVQDPI